MSRSQRTRSGHRAAIHAFISSYRQWGCPRTREELTRELERAIADVNAASHQPAIFQQLEADIKQAGLFVAKLMTGLEKVRLDLPSPSRVTVVRRATPRMENR